MAFWSASNALTCGRSTSLPAERGCECHCGWLFAFPEAAQDLFDYLLQLRIVLARERRLRHLADVVRVEVMARGREVTLHPAMNRRMNGASLKGGPALSICERLGHDQQQGQRVHFARHPGKISRPRLVAEAAGRRSGSCASSVCVMIVREAVELRRERYFSELLDPRRGFERTRAPVEVRWDPLTGQSCRLLPEGSIPPPERYDLQRLANETASDCPFCRGALARATPRFPPEIWADGHICCGEAVAFPNLVPYAKWSSVSIYSQDRHLLPIEEITPRLLADNLLAQTRFASAVCASKASTSRSTGHPLEPRPTCSACDSSHVPISGL